jgi:hypothetical protein
MKSRRRWIAALLIAATWQGCGPGGTGSGNPAVRIVSQGYSPTAAALRIPMLDWLMPSATAASGVTSFQFCVTKLKLDAADGSPIEENGSSEFEARLGRIDLGDGSSEATWGEVGIPAGTDIKRIKIEIHKDPELCGGAAYSAIANGQALTKDLEFAFSFVTAKPLAQGDVVTLALTNLISKLSQALQAGQFDDQHISNYLDGTVEDSCH